MTAPTPVVAVSIRATAPTHGHRSVPLTAMYRSDDPWAVVLDFGRDPDGNRIMWAVGREVLAAGLHDRAGLSDVQVWPLPRRDVALRLSSPDGEGLFHLPRRPVETFLARTFRVVPVGYESMYQPMPDDASSLLDGAW